MNLTGYELTCLKALVRARQRIAQERLEKYQDKDLPSLTYFWNTEMRTMQDIERKLELVPITGDMLCTGGKE